MKNTLLKARKANGFTQSEAAALLGISLRSYKSYETEKEKQKNYKYDYFVKTLEKNSVIDEEHGIITINEIRDTINYVLKDYNIEYCYLFGSYAKGKQNEISDVDLLISGDVNGIKFYGLVEKIRERLKKKVDLLDSKQLKNNQELINEILKDGIKIYG